MEDQLIIRLNRQIQLFITIFASIGFFLMFTILYIVILSSDGFILIDFMIMLSVALSCFVVFFLVYLFLGIFYKVYLYIDKEKIVKKRKNKIYFEITWVEIKSIKYNKLKWWNIFNLFFFSKDLIIEKRNIKTNAKFADIYYNASMSYKDALKIKELFYQNLVL